MALLPQVPDLFPILFTTLPDLHVGIIAHVWLEGKRGEAGEETFVFIPGVPLPVSLPTC